MKKEPVFQFNSSKLIPSFSDEQKREQFPGFSALDFDSKFQNSQKSNYKTKSERRKLHPSESRIVNKPKQKFKFEIGEFECVDVLPGKINLCCDKITSKKTFKTCDTEFCLPKKDLDNNANCHPSFFSLGKETSRLAEIGQDFSPRNPISGKKMQNELLEPFLRLDYNEFLSQRIRTQDFEMSIEEELEYTQSPVTEMCQRDTSPVCLTTKDLMIRELSQHISEEFGLVDQTEGVRTTPCQMDIESPEKQTVQRSIPACCSCKKSKCLKLYCECFRSNGFCGAGCSCQDCYNQEQFTDIRDQFYVEQLQRNPSSFSSKIVFSQTKTIYARGCNCKKTECMKNYCECFAAKVKCSNLCKCTECQNFDEALQEKGLQKYRDCQIKKRKKSEKNFQDSLNERLASRKGTYDNGETPIE